MFGRRTVHARIQKHLHTHTDIHRLLPPTHAGSNCIHNRSLAHTQDQLTRNCTHARAKHRCTHGDMMTHSLASIHLLACSFAHKLLSSLACLHCLCLAQTHTRSRTHFSHANREIGRHACSHGRSLVHSCIIMCASIHTCANAYMHIA